MFDRFTITVALRHVRFHSGQTFLTVGVVAISVTLVIFLTALIGGLQKRLVSSVTGSIPHLVVRQGERIPVQAWDIASGAPSMDDRLYFSQPIRLEAKKRKIEDWVVLLPRLQSFDSEILAVSPVVEDQAIVSRGSRRQGVTVLGVIPERHNQVVDIQSKLVAGRFFGLNAGEAAVGFKLAEDFSVTIGDKIRLLNPDGSGQTYTLAGIFDTGFKVVDANTVFLPLRDAQSFLGLGMAVTSLGMKLRDTFQADTLATRLGRVLPYEVVSWMRDNQSLLSGLKAQSSSSNLILAFTTAASGLGIASILIMSVVGKMREIGILKSMGATNRQITGVFVLQGALLAFLGGILGSALGSGLCSFLLRFKTTVSATGRRVETFPMDLPPETIAMVLFASILVGVAASLYPSWRASRIDPIAVIRGA